MILVEERVKRRRGELCGGFLQRELSRSNFRGRGQQPNGTAERTTNEGRTNRKKELDMKKDDMG